MAWSDAMLDAPSFPPLLTGRAAAGDPFRAAIAAARKGTDAGLVLYRASELRAAAALVLAPEVPLEKASEMVIAAGLGFSDAFGALAPAEIGVSFAWPADILVNAGRCGRLRAAAATRDPDEVPDWLVVGIEVDLAADPEIEPGLKPDETSLAEEGAPIEPMLLVEAWARHALARISAWLDGERARLHADWTALASERGQTVTAGELTGTFAGFDEHGGLLLRTGRDMHLVARSTTFEPC